MAVILGANQYGKAENRVMRVYRDNPRHEVKDINVSTSLRGDFSDAHLTGDQARILPTDTQKNTCYAYAKEKGIGEIEDYAIALATHFVNDVEPVEGARIEVDEYSWDRITIDGVEHDHSFVKAGGGTRTTIVQLDGKGDDGALTVVSGVKDLVLLKTTGSEFAGFLRDEYTSLVETHDRIMSTSVVSRWRYDTSAGHDIDWGGAFGEIRSLLLARFADVHSLALQQTLWEMGKSVLETRPEVAEIKLSAPNIHHFVYDLQRFDIDNPNEVFHVDDRPYGLIQATVTRDDNGDAGLAWYTVPAFV